MALSNRDILAVSAINGVGPSTISKLLGGGYQMSGEEALLPPRILEAFKDKVRKARIYEFADRQLEQADEQNLKIISKVDGSYPDILRQTQDSPAILYVKGDLSTLDTPTVGVIGTREPTLHGKVTTERVTAFFAEQGYTVVSGLALGCDAISHQECVRLHSRGIVVLAHGLHTIAPKRNAPLANAILEEGGVLVSEFALGVEPQPRLFVQRDKTQALLSKAVVMVQSDLSGGSLHASRAALRYDRALVIPYPTAPDIARNEPKIQANLVIAGTNVDARIELLRCDTEKLKNIFVIKNRNDYPAMLKFIDAVTPPPASLLI